MSNTRLEERQLLAEIEALPEDRARSLAEIALELTSSLPDRAAACMRIAGNMGYWRDVIEVYCKTRASGGG